MRCILHPSAWHGGSIVNISTHREEIWVILTDAIGDNEQCMTLTQALGRSVVIKRLDWPVADDSEDRRKIAELLEETRQAEEHRRALGIHAPWPRMVICCGRRSNRVAFWIRRRSGGYAKVVGIGRARRPLSEYDLLVASPQFPLPEHANVVHLPLPMARRRPVSDLVKNYDVTVPKPWFTILLGGEVKQFVTSRAALKNLARQAQLAAWNHGGTVVVSTSRRTPPALLAAIEDELCDPHIYRWSPGVTTNPYEVMLQHSAALFVTADSMSMILDACGSGTPTYIVELPERLDLRRRCRRSAYRLIRGLASTLHDIGLDRVGDKVDQFQDWLHFKRILRYPRDLRRLHAEVYRMGLAQPSAAFDPTVLPARRSIADLAEVSRLDGVAKRCLELIQPWMSVAE
jgi:mitochondrial fission protein ELM1